MTADANDANNLLMRAIDNDNNASMEGLTSSIIKTAKNDVLQKLGLTGPDLREHHRKLKQYRFVEDLEGLRYGSYVRWIDLTSDTLRLTNGGIVCDMNVSNTGVLVTCRNNMGRMFSFNLSECVVFQKLSEQEKILLAALDYLND
jgi:hypothetical protein